ncbi:hypothetical protein [Hwangdonia lutea]|uniref:Uncharacterized protein n=1 Tax=Hwangdonia lutea TaxID=3075823 RepID=A0AA97EPX9_9FLAO|nr:hypothetical protein [Hwangdonia sp. SCSIO 19198]WOD44931.1 hypothetical protein RNZ46_06585 [Hwangdonia sp. SCSIO 19198]
MKIIFLLILAIYCHSGFSQDCSSINTEINSNYSYTNSIEDLEMPLNEDWNIVLENKNAVLVFMKNDSEQASAGIMKNKNGYYIKSAHDINDRLIDQLIAKMGINLENRMLKNVKLKNIPAKLIIYNHKVYNLDDTHLMSGIMYMIVNDGYTYVFTFNTTRSLRNCYIPLFQNIIKNTYFGPEWY